MVGDNISNLQSNNKKNMKQQNVVKLVVLAHPNKKHNVMWATPQINKAMHLEIITLGLWV